MATKNRGQTKFTKKIEQLGNITWLDRLHDMRKVYSKTRILIVPSQWREAWGRVVSEAHMSGIPVLASNIGGLPESVGPGGQLLDPTDVEAWNSALRTMWNDPEVWSDYSTSAKNFSLRSDLRENDIAESYERALRSFSKMQRR
ncbi:glycosyltransferase [Marinobacter sp. AN1]|uniref:glycosyltransferase n=1 Tax=Marinobacter sp. AN1 TaxID=2886046 RepID=UPI0039B6EBA4